MGTRSLQVGLVVGHDDVPAVHAELTSVGDGVTRLQIVVRMAEQMACSAAVDTDNGGMCSHGLDRSGPAATAHDEAGTILSR